MDENPLIRFAEGPAGRRARLVGTGKDVWEVIAVVRDNDGDIPAAADYLKLPFGLVQAAVTYYGDARTCHCPRAARRDQRSSRSYSLVRNVCALSQLLF